MNITHGLSLPCIYAVRGNEIKPTNLHKVSESVLVMNEIKLFFMNKMKAKRKQQKKPRLNRV